MSRTRWLFLSSVILAAAASRVLPHPPNFTPIGAMALFGGAYFGNRFAAFAVPLAALFLSDLVVGLHGGIPIVYLCFAATVCIGLRLRSHDSLRRVAVASFGSAVLFYLVTNFAVWLGGHGKLYPLTLEGLAACYIAALPFLRNMILGNLVYAAVLFGGWVWAERRFAILRAPEQAGQRA